MKKWIVLVTLILLTLSMAACGEKEPGATNGGIGGAIIQDHPKPDTDETTTPPTEKEPFDIESWGYVERFAVYDGKVGKSYYINLPNFLGSQTGACKIAEQMDGTMVLMSGQNGDALADSLSGVFSANVDRIVSSLESLYGARASNFVINIDSSEPVTIGEYDMYTHKGTITYDYEGTQRVHQYVAYASQLKVNGAHAFWAVYDYTEDQSKGDLVAEHAFHMAQTFREEER